MAILHIITTFLIASIAAAASTCHFRPSSNATSSNYPGSPLTHTPPYPYNVSTLTAIPVASICTSSTGNRSAELDCARTYINAIDEQLAFLYARRLGYAAVAGISKYATNTGLNDPSRNEVVAQGMADKVLKYGATETAGRVMGGEGCMIYAALEYEVETIQQDCDCDFKDDVERVCS